MSYYVINEEAKIELSLLISELAHANKFDESRPANIAKLNSLFNKIANIVHDSNKLESFANMSVSPTGTTVFNQHSMIDSGEYSVLAIRNFLSSDMVH